MDEAQFHTWLVRGIFVVSVFVFVGAGGIAAPYGRHAREGWGPKIPARWGWVVMESPAVLWFSFVFFLGPRAGETVPLVFAALWLAHYVHRAFIYPFTMRSTARGMPLAVVAMAFTFNVINAYVNARWISALGPRTTPAWLLGSCFSYGAMVFAVGFVINRWADRKLRALRGRGEQGYAIPRGGLFEEVSCPNYFGELVQWIGWAIATWSAAGSSFAVFTAANLIPRARSHHAWYLREFPDYPRRRRAIVPFVL